MHVVNRSLSVGQYFIWVKWICIQNAKLWLILLAERNVSQLYILQLRKINTLEIALQLLSLELNTTNIMIWPEQKACPHFLDGRNLVQYRSIYYRSNGEKLIRYQANTSCVIMFVILMTTLSYKSLLLQGEVWCWSLLRFKGLRVK